MTVDETGNELTDFLHPVCVLMTLDWNQHQDPLNVASLLTEEEQAIQETARDYCQENLLPRVTEAYRHEGWFANGNFFVPYP